MRKSSSVQKVPFLAPEVVTKVIPSPTDGWDAISPLAEMDPKRAPILINWVPRPGYVEVRGGYVPFCTINGPLPVETLMTYRPSTSEQFFAAAGNNIYNITTGNAVSAVSGLNSARWQHINFTTGSGGHVLQCVNGIDQLQQYDGTTWTTPSITGLSGVPGTPITNNFINIYAQKQRLWYILANSTITIFMPVGANTGPIGGYQDLGTLWGKGGYLVAMIDWTVDGGSGPQDYAAFISSRGQVSLYAGTDPANPAAWQLVGTFDIAPPIGRRCLTRIGSDVAVITQQGVIPISQALPFDPSADRSVAITARIQNAMSKSSQLYKGNFGWQFITYPDQTLALLNVPQAENSQQVQYVMNTLTGAWCQFTGWNANCFAIYNDNLYWGDNGGTGGANINQGYVGSSDFSNSIICDMQCAFNWLDEPGKVKRMTMIQPLLTIGGSLSPSIAVDTDFTTSSAVALVTNISVGSMWDSARWDGSAWSVDSTNYKGWLSVDALGHALAVRMRITLQVPVINTGPSGSSSGGFDSAKFDSAVFGASFTPTSFNKALPVLQVNAFNSISEMGGAV
jgi:hypothetical protein